MSPLSCCTAGGLASVRNSRTLPPSNQIFDILPIKGQVLPGATECMEFSFFAFPNIKATAIAACTVEGGPEYQVSLMQHDIHVSYDIALMLKIM
jgi:hypothetical protein